LSFRISGSVPAFWFSWWREDPCNTDWRCA